MQQRLLSSTEDLEEAAAELYRPSRARTDDGFRGWLTMHELGGGVSVTTSRLAPLAIGTGAHREYDYVVFRLQLAGKGFLQQNDREAALPAGSGAFFLGSDSWYQHHLTAIDCVYLQFPRHLLPLTSIELDGMVLRPLSGEQAGTRLLTGYLTSLHTLVPQLSEQQQREAGRSAVDLLMMALRDVGPATPDAPDGLLLQVLRDYIREHAGDPALTVESLARLHAISVRHLYTLFAAIDRTPAAFIREQRLLRARTLLLDRQNHPIATIAASAGFAEPRTFERAFHREYGVPPARWRRDHR